MRRVSLILLLASLAVVILLRCSEKCPFEPCEPVEGRVCGIVDVPKGFALSLGGLRVRTLAGAAGLACDRSFSVPVLGECGAHLMVLTTEDTIPVLLGCCLPDPENGKGEGQVGVVSGDDLSSIIGSPETRVRMSAASTALALTMVNPLVSGATEGERYWFASAVAAHQAFENLVEEVGEGLRSSPTTYLDGESFPDLYTKASRIVSDVVATIRCGGACDTFGLAPYVDDAPGEDITLKNAAFVHYGVGIMDAVADTVRTVLLLPKRSVSNFVQVPGTVRLEYSLGDLCADIHFYKGIVGLGEQSMLDPAHPGGLATLANVSQAVWNLLAVFDALAPLENPAETTIGGAEAVARFAGVIRDGRPADVTVEALECALRYPDEAVGILPGGARDPSDLSGFLSTVRPVLLNNLTWLEAEDLPYMDRFALDLIASPDYCNSCVCQVDGELVDCPDRPVLSNGGVEPDSGTVFTEFTFLVHYFDELGDPPQLVRVGIDGEGYEMDLLAGEPSDGVYRYATNLSPGLHTHYFRCTDTTGATARFPASGPADGPFVASLPVLTNGRVEPGVGSTVIHFKYSVDCYDADGQVPVSVGVFIDGNPRDMEYMYSWGNNHRYRLVTKLPGGPHDYFFLAEDLSGYEVRLPAEGIYDGPSVLYLPELSNPSVSPPTGAWGESFTYEVDYFDQDGGAPWFVNVCYDGKCQNMRLKTGIPSSGTYSRSVVLTTSGQHTYYFICADSTLVPVRLPEAGTFTGPFVENRPGGQRNYDAKVAVHVIAYDPHMNCAESLPEIAGCADIQHTYEGSNFLAFPVFFDLNEYQGVEFGLSWPDWEGSAAWQSCADLSIGDISHPGDGISLVWHDCHLDHTVVPGWVWVYADGPGWIEPCPHPYTGRIKILNCREVTDEPWGWCRAGVNGAEGDDPCQPTRSLHAPPDSGSQGAVAPVMRLPGSVGR